MYIFTFSILFFSAFVDVFLKKGKYYLLVCVAILCWFIFHDGFRWGIATDWNSYYNFFTNCLIIDNSGMEVGYVLLNKCIRSITANYSVFLIFHAIVVYSLISKSVIKYSVGPLFSFFLFYCLMLSYLGMNRQYIAFAICIYSYRFIFERKFIAFLLCILFAFLFHKSSIMFFLAYFLNRQFSTKVILSILFFVILISLLGIMNKIPISFLYLFDESAGDKMAFYLQSDNFTNIYFSILSLIKRSFWVIIAIAYKKGIKNKDEYFDFFFNSYFLGVIIYILLNNTVFQVIISRGLLYYNIAEIFLIPYLLTVFKNGISKFIMFFLIVIYGYLIIEKGFNFYKENLGIDIFRPYNSVLINDTYDAMKK